MGDRSVVQQLQQSGDDLTKARRVDHWIYFAKQNDMLAFKNAMSNKYKIEKYGKNAETNLPYEIQIFHTQKIDLNSINNVTSKLIEIAQKFNGDYDGWETFVVK